MIEILPDLVCVPSPLRTGLYRSLLVAWMSSSIMRSDKPASIRRFCWESASNSTFASAVSYRNSNSCLVRNRLALWFQDPHMLGWITLLGSCFNAPFHTSGHLVEPCCATLFMGWIQVRRRDINNRPVIASPPAGPREGVPGFAEWLGLDEADSSAAVWSCSHRVSFFV